MIERKTIEALSRAIRKEFGKDYKIYIDTVKQGFQEPCFLIAEVTENQDQFLNNKYKRAVRYCIHCFGSEEDMRTKYREVVERLYFCLDRIDIRGEGTIKGRRMQKEISDDDVLLFFVSYDQWVVYKGEEKESMEKLNVFGSAERK